jgi:hypothetical protein
MAKLNKKLFGNRNLNAVGGESVASITLGGVNNSSGYALNDPLVISAPTLPGGVQATAIVSQLGASNKILAITVTEKGSGYTAAPTVTENVGGVQGTLTFTAVLTNTQDNSLYVFAYVTGGAPSSRKLADIVKQRSTTRFKVTTADGTQICQLVTDGAANAVGEMDLTAVDSAGGEYWVKKIGSRRCTVVRKGGGSGGTEIATDSSVQWTFGTPVANQSVQLDNA